jgi:uncharacterized membrane protein
MSQPATSWSEERVERFVGNLLRAGVILAATVILLGGVLYLVRHGGEPADHKIFEGEPPNLVSPRGILASALALESRGIIQLGLLLLIATPVARVVFSIYAFARQRDLLYAALTTTVLIILLASIFLHGA